MTKVPAVPAILGFDEDPLAEVRQKVIEAIKTADLTEWRAAWSQYQELAEALDTAKTSEYQIGITLAKADIWREAHDRVRYWEELLDAETYCDALGIVLPEVKRPLALAVQQDAHRAEYLQALKRYEPAIELYTELDHAVLTNYERGMVNYRLAECYLGLIKSGEDDPLFWDLLESSVQSALQYLEGSQEQPWALRLLDEIESMP